MIYLPKHQRKKKTWLWKVKLGQTNHWLWFLVKEDEDFTKSLQRARQSAAQVIGLFQKQNKALRQKHQDVIEQLLVVQKNLDPLNMSQFNLVRAKPTLWLERSTQAATRCFEEITAQA